MSSRTGELTQSIWYVLAEGRVWGPYARHRLVAFVGEGRLSPTTQVARGPDGPFAAAGHQAELVDFLGAPIRAPEDQSPSSTGAGGWAEKPSVQAGSDRPLLVFAALSSAAGEGFEAALAQHGRFERIGPLLWLIRARIGPASLRNALSRRLRTHDTLLVVEARLDQAAWFNLEKAEERRLRALWAEAEVDR